MSIIEIRDFVQDWSVLIAAVLGVIIAWDKAKTTLGVWARNLNLYHRMRLVEENVDELKRNIDPDASGS